MATVSINAKVGTKISESEFASQVIGGSGDIVANGALVTTDLATAFTAFNTFAAAVIAITGDTFNTTTHQFTFGGATGLTHAQVATEFALLNTAMTDFLAAQTAATANNAALGADVTIIVNTATVTTGNGFRSVLRKVVAMLGGLGIFTS